jgi:mono/diheme cytochrome c family protein
LILFVAGLASVALTVAVTSDAQETEPGERLMNAACQDCHTIRAIQVQAMDVEGWTGRIFQEIERGAKLAKDDVPTLAEYLVRTHGPVPDGPGREVLLNTCTRCHDLFRIKFGRRSPEEWEETLVSMLNEGAELSDESFALVHHYLSTNYGVD